MNCCGWSRGDSGEEHEHQSDAVLGSVMVFRLAAGAVAEVVVPLGLAKAGFLSGSTGVLGVVAAAEERSEDAKFHACVGADDGHAQVAPVRVLEDADAVDLAGFAILYTVSPRSPCATTTRNCASPPRYY